MGWFTYHWKCKECNYQTIYTSRQPHPSLKHKCKTNTMNISPKQMAASMIENQLACQKLNSIQCIHLAKKSAILEAQTAINSIRSLVSTYEKLYGHSVNLTLTYPHVVEYWKIVQTEIENKNIEILQ